ncbi:MAG: hypothetical protein NTV49_14245 [Kiritimatiellaeota bacterium]|nr:hypothetical protein [Kiritimatiellota bacterium]
MFRFRLVAGESRASSVGVALHLAHWSEDVYGCMPGAVYRGNRFRSYPDVGWYGHYAHADLGPEADQIIANIPRLSVAKGGPSGIRSMLSRSLATPAIGLWNPQLKEALWLMSDQGAACGDSLIEITENAEHTDAWIRFASPGVRPTSLYTGGHVDRGHDFCAGETIALKLMAFSFACEDLACFFAQLFAIRKLEMPDRAELPGLTFSRALALQRPVIDGRWSEQNRIFRDELEEQDPWYFQTGHCGGMMKDYPIYALDSARSGDRVKQALESYNQGWAPSGLMHGRMNPAGQWLGDCEIRDGFAFPEYEQHMTMSRRQGDALLYLIKTARLIRRREPAWKPPEAFHANLKRLADVLCGAFNKFGQLGQYLDHRTGDVVLGGSTSAAGVPPGLVAAWREFGDRSYLDTAQALAHQLYHDYALRGDFNGTPADIMQSPDSEGAVLLLVSMMDLHVATNHRDYLQKARHVAWQLASWIKSYDYDFKRAFPGCTFATMNLKTVGALWASAQNLCGTPGLCVSSGLPLLELYRFDGDLRYLELLRDITHCVFRAVGRPELRRQFPGTKPMNDGWIAERLNTTDMFNLTGFGEFWNASTPWCMTTLMLICLEIPSLYVAADRPFVYPFDTVQVGAVQRRDGGLDVALSNPTDFPATYTVLMDKSRDGVKPLPEFFFEHFQRFDFAPRETRVVHLTTSMPSPAPATSPACWRR